MLLEDLVPDHDRVHDGEDTNSPVVVALGFFRVREEQSHFRGAGAHRGQRFRIDGRFQLAFQKHPVDVLSLRDAADSHPRGRLKWNVLFLLAPPFDRLQIDAVVVLQDAAHPQAGRILKGIQSHPFPVEVGGLLDAAIRALHHVAVAKTAVREHRDGGKRLGVVASDQVGDERKLADVEFPVAQHAPVPLGRGHGEDVELDAGSGRLAFDQRNQQIVGSAGERELERGHR